MYVKCRHWAAVVHLWLPRAILIACWQRVERGKEQTFIEANKVPGTLDFLDSKQESHEAGQDFSEFNVHTHSLEDLAKL